MAETTCAVDGCERLRKTRDWCHPHYKRWLRNGVTGPAHLMAPRGITAEPDKRCAVADCNAPYAALGYCQKHAYRFRMNGDPSVTIHQRDRDIPHPAGPAHPGWKGDDVGYLGAHDRLRAAHGKASDHFCADCGGRAADWSYTYGAPGEMHSSRGYPYTTDMSYYVPRCKTCHIRFDQAHRLLDAWELAPA